MWCWDNKAVKKVGDSELIYCLPMSQLTIKNILYAVGEWQFHNKYIFHWSGIYVSFMETKRWPHLNMLIKQYIHQKAGQRPKSILYNNPEVHYRRPQRHSREKNK